MINADTLTVLFYFSHSCPQKKPFPEIHNLPGKILEAYGLQEIEDICQQIKIDVLVVYDAPELVMGRLLIRELRMSQPELALVEWSGIRGVVKGSDKGYRWVDGWMLTWSSIEQVSGTLRKAVQTRREKYSRKVYRRLKKLLTSLPGLFSSRDLDSISHEVIRALRLCLEERDLGLYLSLGEANSVQDRLVSFGDVPSKEFFQAIHETALVSSRTGSRAEGGDHSFPAGIEYRAMIAAPIHYDQHWLGSIVIGSQKRMYYTTSELELLQGVCVLTGRLVEEMVFHRRVLEPGQRIKTLRASSKNLEKEEAIRKIMTSVAHEINNPLQALQTNLDLARRIQGEEKKDEYLSVFEKEFSRLKRVVGEMFALYRVDHKQKIFYSINDLLVEVLMLYEPVFIQRQIYPYLDLADHLPDIWGIPVQMEQVIINLLNNAVEAMPEGGKIFCATKLQNQEILIMIRDTGPGIPHNNRKRVFEPFFSTKAENHGLGLTICDNIISMKKQGKLEITDHVEGGACFEISLPIGGQT